MVTKQTLKALGIDDKKIHETVDPPPLRALTVRSQPDDIIEKLIWAAEGRKLPPADLKLSIGVEAYKILDAILNDEIHRLNVLLRSDNINQPFGKFEMTALHIAATVGSLAACQAMLSIEGADLSRKDKAGNTPLLLAVQGIATASDEKLLNLVKCLINRNESTVNLANSRGALAIHFVAMRGHKDTLGYLAGPEFISKYSLQQLMAAMTLAGHFGHDVCADYLIDTLDVDDRKDMTRKLYSKYHYF